MKKRIDAFGYAFAGLYNGILKESHLRIHFVALFIVLVLGCYFSITNTEWFAIFICSGLVIAAELFNTAIEKTCDLITKEKNQAVKYIKDVSAGGVLILAIISLIIGCMIFGKRFYHI
jgi:diacylglycerol kinase (ATP)